MHKCIREQGSTLRFWSYLFVGLSLVLLSFGLVACGNKKEAAATENVAPSKDAKKGGSVTFLAAGDIDFIDPGQSNYQFASLVQDAVNRKLYSFKPVGGHKPVPDLAVGDPKISADRKTVTVRIKRGIRFADPVGREVKPEDIKYAFERAFSANVPNSYARVYFGDLIGVPAKPTTAVTPISGIETPDDHTIVFRLKRPTAATVSAALVMPITSPVPAEYAAKFDRHSPSTYDQFVAFTGPYVVKHDKDGKLIGHEPGKKLELVRNPNWDPKLDYRPAYLDSITIQEGNNDLTVAARRTLQGSQLLCCDSGQPPVAVLQEALSRYKQQIGRTPGGGTRWIALNTSVKPFDNLNVRKALFAAFDRLALRLTRGGETVGPIAQHFLPPMIPGFEESNGTKGFADLDFTQKPAGDLALAKQYMERAGKEGVPVKNGKYAGHEKFLAVTANANPAINTAQVVQAQFDKLGFQLAPHPVSQDTLYTKFCGVPKAKVAVCPNVGWAKDIFDPESMLRPTFSGGSIRASANVNWSQLNVPAINAAMEQAAVLPAGKERNRKWADINHQITAQAPAIPFVWDDMFQLRSKDVRAVINPKLEGWDFSYTSLQ